MVRKLIERKQKEADALSGKNGKSATVSVETLAAKAGGMIQQVKRGKDAD